MPIKPEFRAFYRGKAWRATRERIRERAGDRCEQCLVPNHTRVIRKGGWWWNAKGHHWSDPQEGSTSPPRGLPRRIVYIVCTCAHLNSVPGDDRPENLKFLCQWCHLATDRRMHLANSRTTRVTRKDAARPLLQEAARAV